MEINKKHLILTIIITTLAISLNIFIIIQSCLNGAQSTSSSGIVVTLLKNIINTFVKDAINESNIDTFSGVIRKLIGHFGLFLLSGVLSTWSLYLLRIYIKKYKYYIGIIITLAFGLTLAILTETIQLFVPNRSGEFRDVLIDYSGYILGTGIIILICFIIYKKQHKNNEITE